MATVFSAPLECEDLYRAYVGYDAIFQVNVRTVQNEGRLGFHEHSTKVEDPPAS
ncbi:MAG: hypothetical protein R3F62_31255 [Planctomycetota bacterium]